MKKIKIIIRDLAFSIIFIIIYTTVAQADNHAKYYYQPDCQYCQQISSEFTNELTALKSIDATTEDGFNDLKESTIKCDVSELLTPIIVDNGVCYIGYYEVADYLKGDRRETTPKIQSENSGELEQTGTEIKTKVSDNFSNNNSTQTDKELSSAIAPERKFTWYEVILAFAGPLLFLYGIFSIVKAIVYNKQ